VAAVPEGEGQPGPPGRPSPGVPWGVAARFPLPRRLTASPVSLRYCMSLQRVHVCCSAVRWTSGVS